MCNRCDDDPRDVVGEAGAALRSLRRILAECPPGAEVPADSLSILVGLIHNRLDPAVDRLQDFVPRGHPAA